MSSKKKQTIPPKDQEVKKDLSVEPVDASVVAGTEEQVSADDVETLQAQLTESQEKVSEYLDNLQRLQAEFINYKNRQQRDYELNRQTMKGDIIKQVLPVMDDLELALKNRPSDGAPGWVDGIELIYRKLETVLTNEGVVRIEAEGQEFDPNFHEAVAMEPNDEVESGHIIAVLQQGYMIGERVIRPAMVRVAA